MKREARGRGDEAVVRSRFRSFSGRFSGVGGHVGGHSGGTFLEKWGDKSGVTGVQKADRGKCPFLAVIAEETTPTGARRKGPNTLLYIGIWEGMGA